MKKVIILMSVVFMSYNLSAQTSAGDLFAGGGLQFSTQGGEVSAGPNSVEKNSNTSFSITPKVGYFISDQIALGAGIGFTTFKNADANGDYNRDNLISFTPFARYYMPVNEQINFYGEGAIGIATGGSKNVTNNTETNTEDVFGFNVGVRAGVAFFPTEHINIDFGFNMINFNSTKRTDPQPDPVEENVTNTFNFGFNSFAPSIGIHYFF